MRLSELSRVLFVPLLLVAACDCDDCDDQPSARPVSIQVEVFDPVTNFVWEGVSVRVVEAEQEWSQCVCVSPFVTWHVTDVTGQVFIDEFELRAAAVGFLEDGHGAAVLGPQGFEDEATVLLEIAAEGFTTVFAEVPLSWSVPDVFVAVPFN